jgi:anaerobic dimethyl sulfoxide reductase subunit A
VTTVPVSCNKDCGAGCPLIAEVDGGRVRRIFDNPGRPKTMRGCARGYMMTHEVHAPYRINVPLIRRGAERERSERGPAEFREASWDEALGLIARRLTELRDRHGFRSTLVLAGSGACRGAVHNTSLLTQRFFGLWGGYTGTHGSYSSGAQGFVLPYIFGGAPTGMDPATLERSKLVILWGANVVDTRFGCELETILGRLKKRGTPIVVVDPRRSNTAARLGTEWVPVTPGTDTALMAGLLFVLIRERLVDRAFVERYSAGFERLEDYVLGGSDGVPKDPGWTSRITAVAEKSIESLARLYGTARPAALLAGLSIQRTLGGEEAVRMAVALQTATGNVGIPGGSPGCNTWGGLPRPKFSRLEPTGGGEVGTVPVYRWADAVLGTDDTPDLSGPIRAMYIAGTNPVATGSDVSKNRRAFASVEFSVCHDYVLTPTALHCDVVLPATTFLEREDVTFPAGNYLFYSGKAIDPVGQSRNDFDIYADLAARLGFEREFTEGLGPSAWLDRFLAHSEISDPEEFKRCGIHDFGDHNRIGLAGFIEDPVTNALGTPSGKIELCSQSYASAGGPAVPCYRSFYRHPGFPLRLITPHARYRINSQFAQAPWAAEREFQELLMHPRDAAARRIADGSRVLVSSPQGRVAVGVRLTDGIIRGTVCLLAGMWPASDNRDPDPNGAPNVLTTTEPTLPSNSSRTHATDVEVVPFKPRLRESREPHPLQR